MVTPGLVTSLMGGAFADRAFEQQLAIIPAVFAPRVASISPLAQNVGIVDILVRHGPARPSRLGTANSSGSVGTVRGDRRRLARLPSGPALRQFLLFRT